MSDLTPIQVMQCAVWYYANAPIMEQYEAASGESWDNLHGGYAEEKLADYRLGMAHWFSRFDSGRQERWLNAALERYAEDARKW